MGQQRKHAGQLGALPLFICAGGIFFRFALSVSDPQARNRIANLVELLSVASGADSL